MMIDTAECAPAKEAQPTNHREQWEAALAALVHIKAEDAAFMPGYWKAHEACRAECANVPHTTFEPETYTGGRCQTTADKLAVRTARREIAAMDEGRMHHDPIADLQAHYAIKRQLVEAADQREAQIASVRARYNMDWLDDFADGLGDRLAEAQTAVMECPSPDMTALRWKLDHALGTDPNEGCDAWSAEYIAQLRADIARLIPVAG